MSDSTKFLDLYAPEAAWAVEHNISQRTVKRYRDAANGLPYLVWGARSTSPGTRALSTSERALNVATNVAGQATAN
jgi:hypothetical protein